MNDKRTTNEGESANTKGTKPDPETLHNTDPQKDMKGPVSSLMHNTGKGFESSETKKDADRRRDEHM
jgi:hypothetical protein